MAWLLIFNFIFPKLVTILKVVRNGCFIVNLDQFWRTTNFGAGYYDLVDGSWTDILLTLLGISACFLYFFWESLHIIAFYEIFMQLEIYLWQLLGEPGTGGSSTPSMVGAVKQWQKVDPEKSLETWKRLAEANSIVEEQFKALSRLAEQQWEVYRDTVIRCSCLTHKQVILPRSFWKLCGASKKKRYRLCVHVSLITNSYTRFRYLSDGPFENVCCDIWNPPGSLSYLIAEFQFSKRAVFMLLVAVEVGVINLGEMVFWWCWRSGVFGYIRCVGVYCLWCHRSSSVDCNGYELCTVDVACFSTNLMITMVDKGIQCRMQRIRMHPDGRTHFKILCKF